MPNGLDQDQDRQNVQTVCKGNNQQTVKIAPSKKRVKILCAGSGSLHEKYICKQFGPRSAAIWIQIG